VQKNHKSTGQTGKQDAVAGWPDFLSLTLKVKRDYINKTIEYTFITKTKTSNV
jgi:hypothetical protein